MRHSQTNGACPLPALLASVPAPLAGGASAPWAGGGRAGLPGGVPELARAAGEAIKSAVQIAFKDAVVQSLAPIAGGAADEAYRVDLQTIRGRGLGSMDAS